MLLHPKKNYTRSYQENDRKITVLYQEYTGLLKTPGKYLNNTGAYISGASSVPEVSILGREYMTILPTATENIGLKIGRLKSPTSLCSSFLDS